MNCSEYLNYVKKFLDNDNIDFNIVDEFAYSQDGIIFDNYKEMKNENEIVADYIASEFPYDCDEYEYGENIKQYKDKIRTIYNKAISLLKE